MSTSDVSMTGRKMQLWCRKPKFPPCSVTKTDPPPENGADISINVEYFYSWFLISIGLSMFYVDIIRFHDWEEDASRCPKLKSLPYSVPKTDPPNENGADISTNVEFIYSRFLISIGLSMFYVDIIRFNDWEKDAFMVCKTYVPTMFDTKNRSSSWNWRWYFHQCWIYFFPIFDFNRPIYVLCRHHTFPWLGGRCKYGVQNLSSHHVR